VTQDSERLTNNSHDFHANLIEGLTMKWKEYNCEWKEVDEMQESETGEKCEITG
jgi:hypothetical protein